MNILEKICEAKKDHVTRQRAARPLNELIDILVSEPWPAPRFIKAIKNKPGIALIAEIKKASPSAGIIREDFDPAKIASIYEEAGASCLSVLTDTPSFQGKDEYIAHVKAVSSLPVLRKDFIVDLYQVYETKVLGADCLLLIMATLSDEDVITFYNTAQEIGLDVLVEVHSKEELGRALELINPEMIGINNRDLKTLKVDIHNALEMAAMLPEETIKVAESGIKTHDDVKTLSEKGFDAILVGESLMRERDIAAATRKLLGNA